jgi:hypothetical protein
VAFAFDLYPHVLMPSTGGIGGSGQKVSEWRFYATSSFDPVNGEEHRGPRSGINFRGDIFLLSSLLL